MSDTVATPPTEPAGKDTNAASRPAAAALTTWRLTLEYDGRGYSGWQRQTNALSVQEVVEDALSKLMSEQRVIIHAAGRTDAGVHALGQVISFRTPLPRTPLAVRLGLNTRLPDDIAVVDATPAHPSFHARYSATGKTYRYLVLDRPDRSPFWASRAVYLRQSIDWEKVDAALPSFLGRHDFSAFRGPGARQRSPIRVIESIEHRREGGLHVIEVTGPGFLRYQVRIMVGTLIDIGLGRLPVESVATALGTGSREAAGRTAPAHWLYLVSVRYPEGLLHAPTPEGALPEIRLDEAVAEEPERSDLEADEGDED